MIRLGSDKNAHMLRLRQRGRPWQAPTWREWRGVLEALPRTARTSDPSLTSPWMVMMMMMVMTVIMTMLIMMMEVVVMMMTVRMSFPSKSKTLSSPRGEIRITFNDAASAEMTAMMRSDATKSFIFSLVRSLNGLQRFKGLQGINQGGSANSLTYLCEVGLLTDEDPLAGPCLLRSLGCVNNELLLIPHKIFPVVPATPRLALV